MEANNNQKLREALDKISDLSKTLLDRDYDEVNVNYLIQTEITSALSEPPRNCDKFMDELDAQIEFLNDEWLISVTKDTMLERDKFENWTEEMKSRYAKWLFVKAKEDTE